VKVNQTKQNLIFIIFVVVRWSMWRIKAALRWCL